MCSKDLLIVRFLHFQNCRWRVDVSMAVRPVFCMLHIGDCTESSRKRKKSQSFLRDSRNTLCACMAWCKDPKHAGWTVQCLICTGKSIMKCEKFLCLYLLTAEACRCNPLCVCIANSCWSELKNSLKRAQFWFAGLHKLKCCNIQRALCRWLNQCRWGSDWL